MNEAQQGAISKAYQNFVDAGGTMFIDGQAPDDTAAMLGSVSGFDDIDIAAFLGDLRTLKMQMEANALGDQAGAAFNSKAIMHVNTGNYRRTGCSWTSK